VSDWFADDAFWTEVYPFEFPREMIDAGDAQVEKALRLDGVPQRGHALDVGCGPGRHAIPLARRGFRVTAIDLSAFHLAKAAQAAAAANVEIELVRADMRTFACPDRFDLALSLFTSFGYFEDKADDLRVLKGIHGNLRDGGTLVMDVMSKERLARIFQASASQKAPDGALLVQRHEIVDDWTRVRNEWTIIRGDRARTFAFTVRVYSGQELRELLVAAGFEQVALYGALDQRPYGLHAERLVAVAVKPHTRTPSPAARPRQGEQAMPRIWRVYSGADGRSHIAEVPLAMKPFVDSEGAHGEAAPTESVTGLTFRVSPPGYVLSWHCAPRRQYSISLSGAAEIEVGDGTKVRVGPGDVVLAEDLTGQGHITRVVGDQPRFYAIAPLTS